MLCFFLLHDDELITSLSLHAQRSQNAGKLEMRFPRGGVELYGFFELPFCLSGLAELGKNNAQKITGVVLVGIDGNGLFEIDLGVVILAQSARDLASKLQSIETVRLKTKVFFNGRQSIRVLLQNHKRFDVGDAS